MVMNRRLTATMMFLLATTLFVGCSSPLGDDDDTTATPTLPAATTTATAAASPSASATPTEVDSDVEPSASEAAETTSTEEPSTSTRTDLTPEPTATDEPLPADGAQLTIDGNRVTKIIPGSDTGRTMYAVAGDLLWRTNDGGHSWSEAGEGDVGEAIVALNEQNVVYTGDRGGCGRGFSFHEFRHSTDAGRNWETIEGSMDIEPFLAYEAQDAAYVYGSECGLSVSTDGGATWTAIPDLNGEDIFGVATERTDPMEQIVVVAATEGGTGRLFLFDTTKPANPLFVDALAQYWGDAAVDWSDGRMVLAHAHLVGVSDDGGETWQWSRRGLEDATFSANPLFEPIPDSEIDPFRRFEVARIDPTDRDRIWIGGTRGAYLSVDGGQTWERVGDDVEVTGIAIATLTDRVFVSTPAGTYLWEIDTN